MQKLILLIIATLLISACSNKKSVTKTTVTNPVNRTPITNEGRYEIEQDIAPEMPDFDVTTQEKWNVQSEPKSRYGNHSPYIVFGKTYHLEDTKKNFQQTGTASWYGKKFHGHTTSNMEIFDMYKFTAAHRTLPLPSYIEVTNLDNNKKIVVRVNDRGPFKGKRIIDLSWAAAKALEYDKKGLANVSIKLIQAPGQSQQEPQISQSPTLQEGLKFLQVGAFSEEKYALNIANKLSKIILLPVHVTNTVAQTPLYRVRIGPITEESNIIDIIEKVNGHGFNHTQMIVE